MSNLSLKEAMQSSVPADPDPRDEVLRSTSGAQVQEKTTTSPALTEVEMTRTVGAEDEARKKNDALKPLLQAPPQP